eukprot:CAMPEP_0177727570 /NCGR_PEP_ID=MMETSP0484_2-20121128/20396_1 /TAXON_ID=354590 /ORGANISM="Rhodomonas lens, Strain RHODO" /LENGTH=223 /DNA_ID=CAMNT_0019240241 /DNA_START=53 /DNA_END=721 /DNA_ORIENTATION=+
MRAESLLRAAATLILVSIAAVCVPRLLSSEHGKPASSVSPAASQSTQLMGYVAYPDGRDVAALTYDQEAGEKKRTLHQLAAAALENQRLKAPPTQSSTQRWTSKIASADNPAAALQALQGKAAAGSAQAKELSEARENIAAVLAQSHQDMALRKSVLKAAQTNEGTGNSWNSLLKRQIGPHSLALASDWLSTEEATTKSKNKKSMLARAQLAAALSQVGGHFG